jgi:hypothetical protein
MLPSFPDHHGIQEGPTIHPAVLSLEGATIQRFLPPTKRRKVICREGAWILGCAASHCRGKSDQELLVHKH